MPPLNRADEREALIVTELFPYIIKNAFAALFHCLTRGIVYGPARENNNDGNHDDEFENLFYYADNQCDEECGSQDKQCRVCHQVAEYVGKGYQM